MGMQTVNLHWRVFLMDSYGSISPMILHSVGKKRVFIDAQEANSQTILPNAKIFVTFKALGPYSQIILC